MLLNASSHTDKNAIQMILRTVCSASYIQMYVRMYVCMHIDQQCKTSFFWNYFAILKNSVALLTVLVLLVTSERLAFCETRRLSDDSAKLVFGLLREPIEI